jgi:hypothetical protein
MHPLLPPCLLLSPFLLLLQVSEGLADTPTDKLDYSLKQDCEQVLAAGKRIAGAMVKYFEHAGKASGGWAPVGGASALWS